MRTTNLEELWRKETKYNEEGEGEREREKKREGRERRERERKANLEKLCFSV